MLRRLRRGRCRLYMLYMHHVRVRGGRGRRRGGFPVRNDARPDCLRFRRGRCRFYHRSWSWSWRRRSMRLRLDDARSRMLDVRL